MDLRFCLLLNAILVSRLVFTFTDTPVSRRQTVFMIVLQSAALLAYELRPVLALLAGVLLLINILFHFLESRLKGRTTELRLLWLLAQIIVLGIFFSPWRVRWLASVVRFFSRNPFAQRAPPKGKAGPDVSDHTIVNPMGIHPSGLDELQNRIRSLLTDRAHLIVGIDGACGVAKTTLATQLAAPDWLTNLSRTQIHADQRR